MSEEGAVGLYLGGNAERRVQRFPSYFSLADASFSEARFVVAGLPYDGTVSYRYGARLGPDAIRQASWNLERWSVRTGVDLGELPIHDMGDVDLAGLEPGQVFDAVHSAAVHVVHAGKFPFFFGGEHSTIPPVVHALKRRYADLGVLQIDAHLDYRREYDGTRDNHACAMRRIADAVGPRNMVGIGIRSVEKEEHDEAVRDGFRFFTSYEVARRGISEVVHEAIEHLDTDHLYVTLDIDGIDPAYAPATGTPEPFGLTPFDVMRILSRAAPQMVGFDVNEVSPPWDAGNTASLAAKIAFETLAEVWRAQGPDGPKPRGGRTP